MSKSKLGRGPSAQQGTTPGVRDPWISDVRRRLDRVERELSWVRFNICLLTAVCVVLLVFVTVVAFR